MTDTKHTPPNDLIAAARDMLRALQIADTYLCLDVWDTHYPRKDIRDAIDKAKSVGL